MATIIDSHFGESAVQVEVSQGLSVEGIVRQCEIPEAIWSNVVIVLNGIEVSKDQWDSVYPVQSDVISVHVVPLGSDGKQILRLVAIIAVAIAAPSIGTALAGKLGITSTFGISAVQAGVAIVGSLAINALIPPPTIRPNVPGGSATSNAYFLSGQSNRARPYEVCPITYGLHKIYFNLASAPHIFNAGTSSLFQAVYDIGVGGYAVSDIKVGDTAFNLFKNRSLKLHAFAPEPETQTANSAFKPIDLQIYNFPIKSVDLSIGLNDVGDFGISSTHPECHTAVLEISFPSGLAYFDDQGETQGSRVRYYVGYRASGETDFKPIPAGTKAFAGDDHLSFSGVTGPEGGGGGPIDENSDPIYEAKIGGGPVACYAGDKTIIRVGFENGNPGYYGDGYNSFNDPERPKESFWWERIDDAGNVVEEYQTRSTVNSGNDADWNRAQWAYNQEPDPLDGYTPIPPSAAYGTMVADDPGGLNKTVYAFEFIAPTVEGRYRLKMDMYEWWSLPYNTGGDRLADAQQTFTYALDYYGNPLEWTVSPSIVTESDESFNDQDQASYSFTLGSAESSSPDGPWEPVPPTNTAKIVVWWKGTYYDYASIEQTRYVYDNVAGKLMKVSNVQRDNTQFYTWVAQAYYAIKDAGIQKLINEGVLYPHTSYSREALPSVGPAIININDSWYDDTFPQGMDNDEFGTYFWVYGGEATPGIVSLVLPMPAVGFYEFRVERVDDSKSQKEASGEEVDENRYIDSSTWSRIGSRGQPNDQAVLNLQHRHTLFECEFEANQSIQGNVQEINALVRPYIRSLRSNGTFYGPSLYDDANETAYDNPAWIVLDILLGWTIQNRRAPRFSTDHCGWLQPDQLDLGSFYSFAQHCKQIVTYQTVGGTATRKRYTTNMVMASDAPIIETCQNILGQCRAQLIITQAGKIGVMLDEARVTPRQLFTPSNSWDFSGSRSFTEIPHAFNVQFISPDLGWQQATVIVYRPGYDATGSGANEVATLFEDLDTVGITNSHQAQLYGAYMLAQAIVRNEVFTLNADTENLVCQRGDLVQVAHDAPLMGGRSCVITGESGGWLHISERFGPLDSSNNRYTLRTEDGTIVSGSVTAINDDQIQISNQAQADVGNLIVIGEQNLVTEDYLIQSIRPKPDMTAEISLVKYDERVYQVDQGIYPIWSPNFSQNDISGGTHTVTNISGSSTLIYKDRQPYTRAVLNWGVTPDNDTLAGFYIEWQRQGATNRESLAYVASGTRTFTHDYSSRSDVYGTGTYFVVPYSALGYRGTEAYKTLSKRVDVTPPTVTGFGVAFTSAGNTVLSWDEPTDPDIQGYSLYYKETQVNPGYGGEKIGQAGYNRTDWFIEGTKEGLYWIVATDTSGNNSDPRYAGSYDTGTHPTPGLVTPFSVEVYEDRVGGMLHWDKLSDTTIASYTLYQSWEPAEFDMGRATRLATVAATEDFLAVERPFGAFWIYAENIFGVQGPVNRIQELYRIPPKVQNFKLYVEGGNGVLRWDLISDVYIDRYEIAYSENTEVAPDLNTLQPVITVNNQTNSAPSEKLEGMWFIRAVNIYGIEGEWVSTSSVIEGLAVVSGDVKQKLKFIGRYPYSEATVFWTLQGDKNLLDRYRVFFYPTDPNTADTYEDDAEALASRPPVLVYEGPDTTFVTQVNTSIDTGRQHGYFQVLPISIYGVAGTVHNIDFDVIKDVTPPKQPERFFVNIVSNTNADLSWILSQSVDVDYYDIRYTPQYNSPRWEASEHIARVGWNVTGYQTNARTGSYLIRAIDTSGNKSDVVVQRTTIETLPDMNVIERIEDAPDWLGKMVYFKKDGGRLLMDGAPYTGGDEFGALPYRESVYYKHERVDLGRVYETRLTAKLEAYGQLSGSVMADWETLAEIDPIAGVVESADWDCWVEYRSGTQADVMADWVPLASQDPLAGSVASDWTEWRAFFAADVTVRFLEFRIVARAYNPNAEVGVISGLIEVDMPDRYWTQSDIPVVEAGTMVTIDPPFKHIEAVAITIDGNSDAVTSYVTDKIGSSFKVHLRKIDGSPAAGQCDAIVSGYGVERPGVI